LFRNFSVNFGEIPKIFLTTPDDTPSVTPDVSPRRRSCLRAAQQIRPTKYEGAERGETYDNTALTAKTVIRFAFIRGFVTSSWCLNRHKCDLCIGDVEENSTNYVLSASRGGIFGTVHAARLGDRDRVDVRGAVLAFCPPIH